MTVVGEEGTSIDDFTVAQKAELIDSSYLQQNAFDDVDGATPAERQKFVFRKLLEVIDIDFELPSKSAVRNTMIRITDLFRNLNYAAADSAEYRRWLAEIDQFIARKGKSDEEQK
jgi:V/A-type H+-transporting ATPase subunit A